LDDATAVAYAEGLVALPYEFCLGLPAVCGAAFPNPYCLYNPYNPYAPYALALKAFCTLSNPAVCPGIPYGYPLGFPFVLSDPDEVGLLAAQLFPNFGQPVNATDAAPVTVVVSYAALALSAVASFLL